MKKTTSRGLPAVWCHFEHWRNDSVVVRGNRTGVARVRDGRTGDCKQVVSRRKEVGLYYLEPLKQGMEMRATFSLRAYFYFIATTLGGVLFHSLYGRL